jgi:hypothetical protein
MIHSFILVNLRWQRARYVVDITGKPYAAGLSFSGGSRAYNLLREQKRSTFWNESA